MLSSRRHAGCAKASPPAYHPRREHTSAPAEEKAEAAGSGAVTLLGRWRRSPATWRFTCARATPSSRAGGAAAASVAASSSAVRAARSCAGRWARLRCSCCRMTRPCCAGRSRSDRSRGSRGGCRSPRGRWRRRPTAARARAAARRDHCATLTGWPPKARAGAPTSLQRTSPPGATFSSLRARALSSCRARASRRRARPSASSTGASSSLPAHHAGL